MGLVGDRLLICGTPGDDTVTGVWDPGGGNPTLTVTLNGQTKAFNANKFTNIRAELGDGDDDLTFGGAVWRRMTVFLGAGNDHAFTGGRSDVIHGGDGNDKINTSGGDDTIYGDAGNDVLEGASGNDVIYGGAGDDRLGGWTGDNRLYGEAGNDEFWGVSGGSGKIVGGDGYDRVWTLGAKWSTECVEFIRK
jgi:Ca2+-binding RTX toxin-like protein